MRKIGTWFIDASRNCTPQRNFVWKGLCPWMGFIEAVLRGKGTAVQNVWNNLSRSLLGGFVRLLGMTAKHVTPLIRTEPSR